MKQKNKITFIPPLENNEDGWLDVNGEVLRITNVHLFDDFGVEHETLTLEDGSEYFTQDNGETFGEAE